MKLTRALLAPSALLLLSLAGCGDDDSPATTDDDAGLEADDDTANMDDDADDDVMDDDDADDDVMSDDDAMDDDVMDDDIPDSHTIPEDAGPGVIQCAELASTCHPFDLGTGDLGDQCHDVGHEGNVEECAERYDECIAYCSADAGDSEPADGGVTMCEELGHLCHDLDTGPDAGLAHECHEVGHAGDEAACGEIYPECVELCGGEHHEEEVDAGPSLCAELGEACHAFDTGADGGLGHECHEVGHAGDEAMCSEIYDECMVLCGEHHEEGAIDAGLDAG